MAKKNLDVSENQVKKATQSFVSKGLPFTTHTL